MILELKNYRLIKSVELTPVETKILAALSNNEWNRTKELVEYTGTNSAASLKANISYIRKKIPGLVIRNKYYYGYKLDDKIYIK